MKRLLILLTIISCSLIVSTSILPTAQYVEVKKEIEENVNHTIIEIEQFFNRITNIITQKTYSNIIFFNIPMFLILIIMHFFLFFGYFFNFILNDLIFDWTFDYNILEYLFYAISQTKGSFIDMMYLVTMPGGLALFLWASISLFRNNCDWIPNDEDWSPFFLCLSLRLQIIILGFLLVKFADEPSLWDRFNTKLLGLIDVFLEMDCGEFIW